MHRVLFPFVGDTVGGSHLSTLALIEALDRQEFAPVIALHQKGQFAEYLDSRDISYVMAPEVQLVSSGRVHNLLFAMIRCAPALVSFLRARKIVIAHTNDLRMHLTWGMAARFAGVRFVWHQRTRAQLERTEIFANLASRMFVISDYCCSTFRGRARMRIQKIPNPVQENAYSSNRNAARAFVLKETTSPPETLLVAFVGNLREQKRPLIFVKAVARLHDRYGERVKCLIFGEHRPPVAEAVQRCIDALGLKGVCRLMGPRFPIEPWLAGCDLLLAPAVEEGFGRTLVEAMLAGTPVVAAASGGHKEIVEDSVTGLLAPPDDANAFADAAIRLLDDPGRAKALASAARALALERYSVELHAATVQQAYRELIQLSLWRP